MLSNVLAFILQFALAISSNPTLPRPRGVSLINSSLYQPRSDKTWVCLDGLKTIKFANINDDFCDCVDGSDEPGTAACAIGRFHCANMGHISTDIPSSRVNDGVCDCCDASDEYAGSSKPGDQCTNTCYELGRVESEKLKVKQELHKRGAVKRSEMIARAKDLKIERENRLAELRRRRLEQESLKVEKENLKLEAEKVESEALEMYKEQEREDIVETKENENMVNESQSSKEEAESYFARHDTNNDGFVEIAELQVDIALDTDRNGVVSDDEAKFFLNKLERIDLSGFLVSSWPHIKSAHMLAQNIFKPPILAELPDHFGENYFVRYDTNKDGFVEISELQVDIALDNDRNGVVSDDEAKLFLNKHERVDLSEFLEYSWDLIRSAHKLVDHPIEPEPRDHSFQNEEISTDDSKSEFLEHKEDYENEEDAEAYEEDTDIGVGSVKEENSKEPDYDPETQRLIDIANDARNAFAEVEQALRELDNEIKDLTETNEKDYGLSDEYASMDGECYSFEDREYVYTLCPFDRAAQKQRSGGSETTLGRWDQWIGEKDNKYSLQKYSHGAACWNGPQRSATVQLKCSLEHKITAVSEPNRCEYLYEFETPAACEEIEIQGEGIHDEL